MPKSTSLKILSLTTPRGVNLFPAWKRKSVLAPFSMIPLLPQAGGAEADGTLELNILLRKYVLLALQQRDGSGSQISILGEDARLLLRTSIQYLQIPTKT